MNHRHARRIVALVAVTLTCGGVAARTAAARQQPARAGALALVGGTLIDGNGAAPVPNSVILIEGGRIAAVGRAGQLAIPAGAPS